MTDFSHPVRVTMAPNRQKQQLPGVHPEIVKDYDVIFEKDGKAVRTLEVRGNCRRHRVHDACGAECDAVVLRVLSTHGAPDAAVYELRAYEK